MIRCLAALCCCVLVTGCGGPEAPHSPASRGAVILGIDALDWRVLDEVIAAGRAPAFARLRDESASGVNLSFVPLEKSPLIWASIATGLEPDQHGVGGFLKDRGDGYEVLSSAADWRAPAFWDIAGAAGLSSCVIGWWVTFPAREIEGVMVADHVTFTEAGSRNPDGLVRPAALAGELAALTVTWRDVPVELLQALLPQADPAGLADVENPRLLSLRLALAGDLTYLATAKLLAARQHHDVFALYLRGLDLVCHHYWQYYDPGDGPAGSAADRALYGQVVPGYVELLDRWIGELLPLVGTDRNLVVVSDHGFHGPRVDRTGTLHKGVAEHRPEGVLIVRSPLYAPGTRIAPSFVLNVTPTVLALLGLPASQDMPGRVLRDGLTPPGAAWVQHLEAHRLATYASLAPAPPPEVADDPSLDAAVKKQLKSLGYVD
ncbi:MAG TPA: alkaline phosphatase family protein [Candidatus Krumholzibacteria bacterium]|nr:alkaline phosphatase family protein [Candidatus Krumholzibacteria bacterium]HPD72677.1 alkaline phosphatase family protein [Candidatus Krumholzibacteria bacterium]HRY40391.1 alkaline phosphatase family protein [Candidatus Krumholzibacteria bacterium]